MKRIFLGIDLPQRIKKEIYTLAETAELAGARVISEENLHLTLRFIGSATDEQMQAIETRLNKVGEKIKPFEIRLGEVGAFASAKRARVVWVGLSEGAEKIKELAWETEKIARKLGFKEENRFHPHITFIRLKLPRNVSEFIEVANKKTGRLSETRIPVDKISLFESKLKKTDAGYSVLEEFHFLN